MTKVERKRLQRYTFDELWNDLWMSRKKYSDEARGKFQSIVEKIPYLVETCECERVELLESMWTLPKGRKDKNEDDLTCALREFTEEVGVDKTKIEIVPTNPLRYSFVTTKGKEYTSIYFLATSKTKLKFSKKSTPDLIRKSSLSSEASKAKWMTLKMMKKYLSVELYMFISSVDEQVKK